MLTRLMVKNLTVFAEAESQFAPGLNVIVGENGTGKTHVLKAACTVAAVSAWAERDSGAPTPSKSDCEKAPRCSSSPLVSWPATHGPGQRGPGHPD